MQLQLDDVVLFIRITELGSLSAAARERDVTVSQVTRSLVRMETACGVRLLHRSTHGLSLTDEGDTFLTYARSLRDTTAELSSELSGKINGPSGWVRVSVSPLLAQMVIAPSLNGLYQYYPALHLDINADDRMSDMARDGIDIAIRTGTPNSETLVARQIGDYSRALYAAPAYLARCGTPKHPDDLRLHHLIASSVSPALNRWPRHAAFAAKGSADLIVAGHTRTDNSAMMMTLVQQGVGIGRLVDLLVHPLVSSGALVPLLQDYFSSPSVPLFAVMRQERQRLPKIRACIDYWTQWLTEMKAGIL